MQEYKSSVVHQIYSGFFHTQRPWTLRCIVELFEVIPDSAIAWMSGHLDEFEAYTQRTSARSGPDFHAVSMRFTKLVSSLYDLNHDQSLMSAWRTAVIDQTAGEMLERLARSEEYVLVCGVLDDAISINSPGGIFYQPRPEQMMYNVPPTATYGQVPRSPFNRGSDNRSVKTDRDVVDILSRYVNEGRMHGGEATNIRAFMSWFNYYLPEIPDTPQLPERPMSPSHPGFEGWYTTTHSIVKSMVGAFNDQTIITASPTYGKFLFSMRLVTAHISGVNPNDSEACQKALEDLVLMASQDHAIGRSTQQVIQFANNVMAEFKVELGASL